MGLTGIWRWLWLIPLAGVMVGLLYWLLVLSEGTYLGKSTVAWLYDRYAKRYDRVKRVRAYYEQRFVGLPLAEWLAGRAPWRVLDVAAGTGRVATALAASIDEPGVLVAVDHAVGMLEQTPRRGADSLLAVCYAQQDAEHLGIASESVDAVTCLEALEFMPHGKTAVREFLRVLKPGGMLLVSNRIGHDCWYFLGRLCKRGRLEAYLQELGMEQVRRQDWQVFYDLVWAFKPNPNRLETQ